MTENSVLTVLKGVGEKTAKQLAQMGIRCVGDLMMHFPADYRDLTDVKLLKEAELGRSCMFRLKVTSAPYWIRRDRVRGLFTVTAADESATVRLMFFNQSYLAQKIQKDKEYCFYGKIGIYNGAIKIDNPKIYELGENTGIEPIYALSGNLKQKLIRQAMRQALTEISPAEPFSEGFLEEYGLLPLKKELEDLHFPQTLAELDCALKSRRYKELLEYAMLMESVEGGEAPVIRAGEDVLPDFLGKLSFLPTNAQLRSMREILSDLSEKKPMNRLLQGDVGSGKTIVAFFAAYAAGRSGYQTMLMAPTELLAQQHYRNAQKIFGEEVVLLTGSTKPAERRGIEEKIRSCEAKLIIGTHALLYREEPLPVPALVITDEQHRFGVAQRAALTGRQNVHMLIMSATPIPRTLALVLYGKASVSVIDEYPAGRKPVKSYVVTDKKREDMYKWLKDQVNNGTQAYIVCPLIENADEMELRSVGEVYAEVSYRLRGIPAAMLHGRMKAEEKDGIMQRFHEGSIKVLVSTTVIEVGVDVPQANIMIIENAERFGLAQLHQLRGRVGRGNEEAYCYFVSDDGRHNPRLKVLTETTDGFEIAEKDLELRGAGELLGRRQHGEERFFSADIAGDLELLQRTVQDLPQIRERYPQDYTVIVQNLEKRMAQREIVLN